MSSAENVSTTDSQEVRSARVAFWQSLAKANKVVEDNAMRGAAVVSHLAHSTAHQIHGVADYLKKAPARTSETARNIGNSVGKHPLPFILSAAIAGFSLGYWRGRSR